jgi:hypothetical protein
MAKCDRHTWDDRDKEPCWKCEELKYKKSDIMAKEHCVSCGVETAYDFETHIDLRSNYIEGVGQFCKACYNRSYKITEEDQDYKNFNAAENLNKKEALKDLIKETPNNYELGEKVRRLFS